MRPLLLLLSIWLVLAPGIAAAADIRWGTSRVGSSGHRAITNLVQVISPHVPAYRFTVQPTPGALLTVKGYAKEEFEAFYGSDVAFYEYANEIKRFKGFRERASRVPVQSFWLYTVEMGIGIHARDRERFGSWADLTDARVYTGPRPWDTRALLERTFEVLGVEHDYLEVDLKTAGAVLESGRIEAFGVYTTAEATTAPWLAESSLQTDWALLNPSPDEVRQLEDAGFAPVRIEPEIFGKRNTYVDEAILVPHFYGAHLGMDVPADDVYDILLIIEANADALVQADPAFAMVAVDMAEVQRRGVQSAHSYVPIHPGLARYMRERGVWDPAWDTHVAN